MSKVLFTVWPFAGHLHPSIAIAHELRAQGHQVAFYCGASVRDLLEREGFKFFPYVRVDEEKISSIVSSAFPYNASLLKRLRSLSRQGAKFREWLVRSIPDQVSDLDHVLSAWRPDLLVCDFSFWGPILILNETKKVSVAVLSVAAACLLPGRQAPYWGQGLPRATNALMRFRSQAAATVGRWLSLPFQAEVNSMRKRYHLDNLRVSVAEFSATMDLYLVPSIKEFDYDRSDLPSSVRYVGPCLWDNPEKLPPPEWLRERAASQPLIYVTEATVGRGEPFLLKAAALACKDLPVEVVMTTGKQRGARQWTPGELPANVLVLPYVPQSDLLPQASVMVTVGGSGGVLAALKAGVPLVVVPTEWDRQENAQRVVEAGAGLRIPLKQCTPQCLREAIQRVLTEPSFRNNAQRLAKACAGYGGPAQAAQLLGQICRKPSEAQTLV